MGEEAARRRRARGRRASAARGSRGGDVAELRHLAPAPRCGARGPPPGLRIGLYSDGACGRPASSAACGQVELPDRPREVDLRGRPDPDRGRAFDRPVGGDVEVLAEDFLARCGARSTRRPASPRRSCVRGCASGLLDAEVADQLLGDRRAALDRFAGFEVLDRGAEDPLVVDAAVFVEALVLDRDRRQLQVLGDPLDRDRGRGLRRSRSRPSLLPSAAKMVELPPLSIGLQEPSERGVGGDVEHPGGDRDHARSRPAREAADGDEQQLAPEPASPALTSPTALRHRHRVLRPWTLRPGCRRSSGCG